MDTVKMPFKHRGKTIDEMSGAELRVALRHVTDSWQEPALDLEYRKWQEAGCPCVPAHNP